jgi:xanthine dehydrogenase accessory factor
MDAYSILNAIPYMKSDAVLATILSVSGHSYRKTGAMMLFLQNCSRIGSISPGCLEADLQERVSAVLESCECEIISYNMRAEEDPIWGESIGCGGSIRVLLEPVDQQFRALLSRSLARMNAGLDVQLLRDLNAETIQYTLLHESEVCMEKPLNQASREAAEPETMLTVWMPKSRLIVFGGGNDAEAICKIARMIDFHVILADWRDLPDMEARYPGVQIVNGTAAVITQQLGIGRHDFVVICSHQLQRDREMLEQAIPRRPRYIGVLGSQNRIRTMFEGITATANVHAPVGLAIEAEGPEEIAVSIAAELVSVRARARNEGVKGVRLDENSRSLFGSRSKQENGGSEASVRTVAGHHPWE